MANERNLNARPAKSLNQRPATNARPTANKYPTPAAQPQAKSMPGAVRSVQPVQSTQQAVSHPAVQKPPVRNAVTAIGVAPVSGPLSESAGADAVPEFVSVMREMVGGFANLSDEVIAKNIKLASNGGMSNEDRTISFECADFLLSNFGVIVMGLVCDNQFKTTFMEALLTELQIDDQTPEVRDKVRKEMHADLPYESQGSIIIGLTTFVPAVQQDFMNKIQASFDALDEYADEFDKTAAQMSDEDKTEYGFIFSNFMYLIRAFTHNNAFMSYVITVVEKVKSLLSPSK